MSIVFGWIMMANALLLAVLLAASHGLLKWVSMQRTENYLATLMQHGGAVALALSIYGFVFFYYGYILKNFNIAVLYPTYTGLSILFVIGVGAIFFNENVSKIQLVGCLLVIVGIFCISSNK